MLSPAENELITRIGPGTPMGEFWRSFWLPILLSEELPTPDCPPVRVRLLGEDLVAFRDTDGRIGLLDRYCAHRRADLYFGRNEECGLRCVYHGWKYDVEGNCVDMPSEGPGSQFKEMIHLTAYPCQERAGLIWAYLGPKELRPEMPQMNWMQVPESHRYAMKAHLDSNWLQHLEGSIDGVHVQFLHRTLDPRVLAQQRATFTAGNQSEALLAYNEELIRQPYRFEVLDTDYGLIAGARKQRGDRHFWQIAQWLMPAYSLVGGGGPSDTLFAVLRVPMDDVHTSQFRVWWNPEKPLTSQELHTLKHTSRNEELIPGTFLPLRNKDNDWLIDRELQRTWNFTGIRGIPAQDQAVVISMGPIVDRSKEHLGTSDMGVIALRRKLLKLVRDVQEGSRPYAAYHSEVYRGVRTGNAVTPKDMPFTEVAKQFMSVRV